MSNRYCRDELIYHALNMVNLPNLEVHDMPNGVVLPNAYSIEWLQEIIDFWYHMVPFSATVTNVPLNATANSSTIELPSDLILDVRNGYLTQGVPGDNASFRRRIRVPLQKFVNRQVYYQSNNQQTINTPYFYCIYDLSSNKNQLLHITPIPTVNTIGNLFCYKLPSPLAANEKPRFPNDYVCIEYIRIRALEWTRLYDPGTAQKFCDKLVAAMKASGLMNEPEDDEIPFDDLKFGRNVDSRGRFAYSWMGQQ